MEMPDLDQFDMVRFLEDHRDRMRVTNDRIRCTISPDKQLVLFNFEARYFDIAINDVPSRFINEVNLKLSELKIVARQIAYLAPYCTKEAEGE